MLAFCIEPKYQDGQEVVVHCWNVIHRTCHPFVPPLGAAVARRHIQHLLSFISVQSVQNEICATHDAILLVLVSFPRIPSVPAPCTDPRIALQFVAESHWFSISCMLWASWPSTRRKLKKKELEWATKLYGDRPPPQWLRKDEQDKKKGCIFWGVAFLRQDEVFQLYSLCPC